MSYTRYWAISTNGYIAYTLLYIRHTPCTCRIQLYWAIFNHWYIAYTLYTSDIHPVHVVYTVLGHIQHWYIAYTLLYIRHSTCTCRIHGIGHIQPLIHSLYTFIHQTYHPAHVVYIYWSIFNHWYIAYTLLYIRHIPCTCRIRGIGNIFNHWYIAYTLLYIRHTPCTCRIRGIGPYSTIDT